MGKNNSIVGLISAGESVVDIRGRQTLTPTLRWKRCPRSRNVCSFIKCIKTYISSFDLKFSKLFKFPFVMNNNKCHLEISREKKVLISK